MTNKPAIKLAYEEPGAASNTPSKPSDAPNFASLWGGIRIVTTAPTWTPRGRIEDSLALLIDAGTPNLCVYDYTNAQWLFAELSTTRIP